MRETSHTTIAGRAGLRSATATERVAPSAADGSSRARVHRALAELPDDQRRLVELAYWSGLAPHEIAQRLGVRPELMRTQMRVALIRLAELLGRPEFV